MTATLPLFSDPPAARADQLLLPGAWLLPGAALPFESALLDAIEEALARCPPRHMQTPLGHAMSVAMSNVGPLGWVSDRRGYRYAAQDPEGDRPWLALPPAWSQLAGEAAARAGYDRFEPDACLLSVYLPGARMGLHQDRDERDMRQPIVSVSLGLDATFLLGGLARSERARKVPLSHGDVVVFGGPARLAYHGVAPLADGWHARLGARRINLSFRKAA